MSQKQNKEKCPCACHENKLNKPYLHDTRCCEDMNESVKENWEEEFIEKGAALEHDRWARWQNYFFKNDTSENRDRWVRQINTPYSKLSEAEKESDRKEVRKYLPLIRQLLAEKEREYRHFIPPNKREMKKKKVIISKNPCDSCGSTMWHYKGEKFKGRPLCRNCVLKGIKS